MWAKANPMHPIAVNGKRNLTRFRRWFQPVNARSAMIVTSLLMWRSSVGRKPKPIEVRMKFFTARANGATLRAAVAAAGVSKTTGHYWLTQSGGVRPRRRSPRPLLRLPLEER